MTTNTKYQWAAARLDQDRLQFDSHDGLERALADGFFFVDMPQGIDLSAGDCFAENFYRSCQGDKLDTYRGYKKWTADTLANHEGYFLRDVDQVEQFFLEHRFWQDIFPPALVCQAEKMQNFGLNVLKAVLAELELPRPLWDKATGYAVSGQGIYHLTFNHFRHSLRARGLNVHKDSGWLTLLRSHEPGLEVRRGNQWVPITPRPNTFIVNFGCAIEILMRNTPTPVSAIAHRVQEQPEQLNSPDRFSYALFIDSNLDQGLYRYEPDQGLVFEVSFKTFLDNILHNTYEADSEGLY